MTKIRYVLVFILALVAVKFVAGEFGRVAGESVNASEAGQPATSGKITTGITTQEAEDMTKNDLTQDFLQNLENWMVETTVSKAKEWYSAQGYDPESFKPKIDVKSVYTEIGGTKLAVSKLNGDNQVQTVWVSGLRAGEFVRVTCIRRGADEIPVFHGSCGSAVKQAFGVSVE